MWVCLFVPPIRMVHLGTPLSSRGHIPVLLRLHPGIVHTFISLDYNLLLTIIKSVLTLL